jgi:hypothetical protein
MLTLELNTAERDLLKILGSFLSDLRQAIDATKRDTSLLHAEENRVKDLQRRLSELTPG